MKQLVEFLRLLYQALMSPIVNPFRDTLLCFWIEVRRHGIVFCTIILYWKNSTNTLPAQTPILDFPVKIKMLNNCHFIKRHFNDQIWFCKSLPKH